MSGCEEKETLLHCWWEGKVEKTKEVLEKLNEFTSKPKETHRLRDWENKLKLKKGGRWQAGRHELGLGFKIYTLLYV